AAMQPAIFAASDGRAIVVHNADYSLATDDRPLERGEYAFVYATGLGPVSNRPPTGAAASGLASTVTLVEALLGGQPCEVQFAGLAPWFAGVYQLNFRVPQSAASGLQSFRLRISGTPGAQVLITVR